MNTKLQRFLEQKGHIRNPIEPYIPEPVELVPVARSKRLQIPSKYLYAYIRVSTFDQLKSGLGLESQFTHVTAFVERIVAERPQWAGYKFAGVYVEAPTSSIKHDLRDRKVGKVLCERLRPGDGVVFLRYDRAFRNFRHMLNQKHEWDERGIKMLFMDLDLDLATPMGEMMLHFYAIIAQVESRNISERTKKAMEAKKARGDKLGSWANCGMVLVNQYNPQTERRERREFIRHDLMPILRLVAFYREYLGMSFWAISDRIDALQAKREGRQPYPRVHFTLVRRWTESRCRGAYKTWKMIVADRRRFNWREHAKQPEEVGCVRGEPYKVVNRDRTIPEPKTRRKTAG